MITTLLIEKKLFCFTSTLHFSMSLHDLEDRWYRESGLQLSISVFIPQINWYRWIPFASHDPQYTWRRNAAAFDACNGRWTNLLGESVQFCEKCRSVTRLVIRTIYYCKALVNSGDANYAGGSQWSPHVEAEADLRLSHFANLKSVKK